MSQASFKLLEFSKFFETEFRDIIDVKVSFGGHFLNLTYCFKMIYFFIVSKGKGSMKTYSLTKKKNVASNNKLEVP